MQPNDVPYLATLESTFRPPEPTAPSGQNIQHSANPPPQQQQSPSPAAGTAPTPSGGSSASPPAAAATPAPTTTSANEKDAATTDAPFTSITEPHYTTTHTWTFYNGDSSAYSTSTSTGIILGTRTDSPTTLSTSTMSDGSYYNSDGTPRYGTGSTTSDPTKASETAGVSTVAAASLNTNTHAGQVAGIVAGSIAAASLVTLGLVYFWIKKRQKTHPLS